MISRRAFLYAVSGSVLVPLAAEPQPVGKLWQIGFVEAGSFSVNRHFLDAFRQGLRELGYVEGQQVTIVDRWAEGRNEHFPNLVAEVIRLKVDIIVVASGNGAVSAKSATSTIPIIFFVDDPVRLGLVASLSRPGGNMTGVSFMGLIEKRVQLLKEVVPRASRVALLWDAGAVLSLPITGWLDAAKTARVKLKVFEVRDSTEFDTAFNLMDKDRLDGLIVPSTPLTVRHRAQVVDLAAKHQLPAIYTFGEFVRAGGLMAYGASVTAVFRRMAYYVDKIIRGANPADLPVEQPTEFELVINLKTAKALGLTIPQSLLLRADQVIE